VNAAEVGALLAGGRRREALALATQGSQRHPEDPSWLHLLGAALHANGAGPEAVATLQKAARLVPGDPVVWNTLGAVLVELGELEEGEKALGEALRIRGDYLEALFNLAVSLRRRGRLDEAKSHLTRIRASWPDFAPAQLELAVLLVEAGDAEAALPILEALLQRHPDDPRLLANTAAAHQRLGQLERAEVLCGEALARPDIAARDIAAVAHTLAVMGHADAAALAAGRAASQDPQSAETRALAADALALAGRHSQAQAHYAFASVRRPRVASLLEKLGRASLAAGNAARAAEAFRDELRLAPQSRSAHYRLAIALGEIGRRAEGAKLLAQAVEQGHRDAEILSALAGLKAHDCDWEGLEELVVQLRQVAKVPSPWPAQPQTSLYLTGVSAAEQRAWAQNWASARFAADTPVRRNDLPLGGRRLRLGYLSADFYGHATAHLMAGMLEHHDRSRFEVIAYSAGVDDGSQLRRRVERAVERFVDIRDLPTRAAAQKIAADRIDVLVDLGGYAKGSRMEILALRPARVQGHFLGYPATTGAPFVDFFVADAVTVPKESEPVFSERILRMPACYQPNDPRRALPGIRPRAESGLAEGALVLCSFNQGYKIQPPVFEQWCRLLQALPDACLWLLDCGAAANGRLATLARARGIHPARLVFSPYASQAEHLARLQNADIALDTFPCGSHTTASDVVWAGVPLIALTGETFASRVSASVLSAAGCSDWAFDDHDKAFEATLAMARDPRMRENACSRLGEARRSSPLFDAAAFARDFEALMIEAVAFKGA
jgi:protein O-GlcNAc transferase